MAVNNGFQVFNADGTTQFDTTNTLARYLRGFNTGTVNGSISIGSIDGDAYPLIMSATIGRATPMIFISGTNVIWDFQSIPAKYRADCTVMIVVK